MGPRSRLFDWIFGFLGVFSSPYKESPADRWNNWTTRTPEESGWYWVMYGPVDTVPDLVWLEVCAGTEGTEYFINYSGPHDPEDPLEPIEEYIPPGTPVEWCRRVQKQ